MTDAKPKSAGRLVAERPRNEMFQSGNQIFRPDKRVDGLEGLTVLDEPVHVGPTDSWKEWNTNDHAEAFDFWTATPTWRLRRQFESFNEFRILKEAKGTLERRSLLDVGCATGELYRYVARYHLDLAYRGIDVSAPAIERAQRKYPQGQFFVVPPSLDDATAVGPPPGILWSRDVVHHQPDAFSFLRKILGLGQEVTILRLRTRDRGASVTDPAKSCQWQYGGWAPYIVLNVDDLTRAITSTTPVRRIEYRKRYEVLGGQHGRHLPKECYDPGTGTAETAVLISHGAPPPSGPEIVTTARLDGPGPPRGLLMRGLGYLIPHIRP